MQSSREIVNKFEFVVNEGKYIANVPLKIENGLQLPVIIPD
jgi:hypothetical protein